MLNRLQRSQLENALATLGMAGLLRPTARNQSRNPLDLHYDSAFYLTVKDLLSHLWQVF